MSTTGSAVVAANSTTYEDILKKVSAFKTALDTARTDLDTCIKKVIEPDTWSGSAADNFSANWTSFLSEFDKRILEQEALITALETGIAKMEEANEAVLKLQST